MKIIASCSSEEMDQLFSTMDRDFDGRLSLAEIMGEDTSVEKLFKMMDKNGDGFISRKVSSSGSQIAFLQPAAINSNLGNILAVHEL